MFYFEILDDKFFFWYIGVLDVLGFYVSMFFFSVAFERFVDSAFSKKSVDRRAHETRSPR